MTRDQRLSKVLELVRAHPGLEGSELVKLYRPTRGCLRALEQKGKIVYRESFTGYRTGWYVKEGA